MKSYQLNIAVTAFLLAFGNFAFFRNVTDSYPLTPYNTAFIVSLGILIAGLILLTLQDSKLTTKPVLISLLLVTSLSAYFMDSYNIVIDTGMIRNILQTDRHETLDLLSPRLLVYFLLLGVLPAAYVYRTRLEYPPPGKSLAVKLKLILVTLLVVAVQLPVFGKSYASFFREHKPLRYYTNPLTWIYSSAKYVSELAPHRQIKLIPLGTDAVAATSDTRRELVILVLGETVRADHLALNGYQRNTDPLLASEKVITLTDMTSCGTSTAVSVPCIFSIEGHAEYDNDTVLEHENLLDVLTHAGVNVLWRDNNSGSKGVADRVAYQDFRKAEMNPVCDSECRDEGMLSGLQEYIDSRERGNIFIVLHQMGNHGPAYFKRYPQAFEQFTPVCKTSQLEDCSNEEIGNAYDNALLYTDYFLEKVIGLLKQNIIDYHRGRIEILDQDALRAASCACLAMMKRQYDHFLT